MREFWKSMVIDIGGPPAAKPYERSEPGEYDRPEKGENSIFGEPHPIMSISTVQDVEAVDNTPKPVASEAAAKTSADIIGFWESISFNKSGMSLTGWAVRKPSGEAPVSFSIPWGDGEENVAPNLIRADVTKMLGRGDDRCGISITAPLPSDITADWTALADRSITATWVDGSTYKLPRIRQFPSIELECLKFTDPHSRNFKNTSRIRLFESKTLYSKRMEPRAPSGWRAITVRSGWRPPSWRFIDVSKTTYFRGTPPKP